MHFGDYLVVAEIYLNNDPEKAENCLKEALPNLDKLSPNSKAKLAGTYLIWAPYILLLHDFDLFYTYCKLLLAQNRVNEVPKLLHICYILVKFSISLNYLMSLLK